MTTIEGMACGLATIASRTGGTPEVVDGQGLFFERESVEGLAKALESLLADERLRQDYASRATGRAREFTWERAWGGLTELTTARS
jgi:phosphatidylinositol alpha-1,6-mannosyltransferase